MALQTQGYQMQMPAIAQVPSHIGHIDVAGAYDILRKSQAATQAAANMPLEQMQRARDLRTLLARAKQEDELRKLDTVNKATLLAESARQEPMRSRLLAEEVGRAPMQTDILRQRQAVGALDTEAAAAAQAGRLADIGLKEGETQFRGTIPASERVLGSPTTVERQSILSPEGYRDTTETKSVIVGGKPQTLSTVAESTPVQSASEEIVEDVDRPGYFRKVTKDAQGNVVKSEIVQDKASIGAVIGSLAQQSEDLIAQAKEYRIAGQMTQAAELEARADALDKRADSYIKAMRDARYKQTAAITNAEAIAALESKENRTAQEDAELKAMRAQTMGSIVRDEAKAEKTKQLLDSKFGGTTEKKENPQKQAGKFKILKVE